MYAKAQVIGNLGRDPETRYTKSGAMNVSFSVAASRRFNDASGTLQERTTWFRVTAWGKLAETLDRLAQDGALVKGQRVFVAGPAGFVVACAAAADALGACRARVHTEAFFVERDVRTPDAATQSL